MNRSPANIAESLQSFYTDHDLGPDGGHHQRFAKIKLGWIPFYIPNTAGRKRALFFHDVHHLVMGFDTNLEGEAQIAAWEIGSGCRDFLAAWILNLLGMAMGLFLFPKKTFAAFCLGRRSKNFYHNLATTDEIGRMTVPQARNLLAPESTTFVAGPKDYLLFSWWSLMAITLGLGPILLAAVLFAWIW